MCPPLSCVRVASRVATDASAPAIKARGCGLQWLSFVLYQIDEARRFLLADHVEGARLALLLLDNAVELQMRRRIESELADEAFSENLRDRLLASGEQRRSNTAQEIVDWEPLSSDQKRAIERYFEPKVRYLSERQGLVDPRLTGPLVHIHRYRNEAYHRAHVRAETVRTAALRYCSRSTGSSSLLCRCG